MSVPVLLASTGSNVPPFTVSVLVTLLPAGAVTSTTICTTAMCSSAVIAA